MYDVLGHILLPIFTHFVAAGAGAFFYAKAQRWLGKKAASDVNTIKGA